MQITQRHLEVKVEMEIYNAIHTNTKENSLDLAWSAVHLRRAERTLMRYKKLDLTNENNHRPKRELEYRAAEWGVQVAGEARERAAYIRGRQIAQRKRRVTGMQH